MEPQTSAAEEKGEHRCEGLQDGVPVTIADPATSTGARQVTREEWFRDYGDLFANCPFCGEELK